MHVRACLSAWQTEATVALMLLLDVGHGPTPADSVAPGWGWGSNGMAALDRTEALRSVGVLLALALTCFRAAAAALCI